MATHTINGHPVTVGSVWRNRDGRKIGPMVLARDASETSYMFAESICDEGAWDENGDYGLSHLIGDHPSDLIAPWSKAPAPDYNDGQWWGWNGGPCPVHPETVVDYRVTGSFDKLMEISAKYLDWKKNSFGHICAFKVVKPYVEPIAPREGWACGDSLYPTKEAAEEFMAKLRQLNPSLSFEGPRWTPHLMKEVL